MGRKPCTYIDPRILEFVKGKTVASMTAGYSIFTVRFDGQTSYLRMEASRDCCDESSFKYITKDFNPFVGKEIKSVELGETETVYYDDSSDESSDSSDSSSNSDSTCTRKTPVIITFSDDSSYRFIFKNVSNGYYGGVFREKIEDT